MKSTKCEIRTTNSPLKGARRGVFSQVGEYFFKIVLFFLVAGCNSENAPDCLQSAGRLTRIEVEVPEFTNITVFENLNLVLKQGDEQKVELESGEFLLNDISAKVEGDRLLLRNDNGCNIFRDYGLSTVYVTAPNITQVRSNTGGLVSSDDVLGYADLSLVSESFSDPELETNDGSFELELDVESVRIVTNSIAYFKLQGNATNLNINIAAGDSRIDAEGLIAENVGLNHRGSNDILVYPQRSISGIIRGTGNVISFNRPLEIDVEELFNGRLIFRD